MLNDTSDYLRMRELPNYSHRPKIGIYDDFPNSGSTSLDEHAGVRTHH